MGEIPAIRSIPPPYALTRFVEAFVHRREAAPPHVVRLLPEPRATIQITRGASYWLREQGPAEPWRELPRIGLWGPRHRWAYGYAAGTLDTLGFGLTPEAFHALTGRAVPAFIDTVTPLADIAPALAAALDTTAAEPFDTWRARALEPLRTIFAALPETTPFDPGLALLATGEGDVVTRAAEATGLSERQYRRRFRDLCGVGPKTYQRALRVDRMLRQLHQRPWETDAYADTPLPFSDQPHAIREFRALTGLTPTAYVAAKRSGDATLRSVVMPDIDPPLV
ncbi:MAG: AraC family transcriptional regulator [Micropepsaceae bacterium]